MLDTEEYAGRESVVESLAAGQRAAGRDARIVAVVEEGGGRPPFLDAAEAAGLPLEVVRLPPRAYLQERRRLADHFADVGADVIHSHGYRPDVVAGSAARKAGIARVSTIHGFVGGGWKNRLYERLQRWSLHRYDAVVAVSTEAATVLAEDGVPEERIHVVRNAWDGRDDFQARQKARERLGVDDDRFHIGWVGRLSREKGVDVLLEALQGSKTEDVVVSIIGDGPLRQPLEERSAELPAGVEVRWHGRLPRAYRLFGAFDVFVLSSRTEGTPMVLLEAMAAGVPVVATTVGGVPDVVSDREARLVPSDRPGALWRAIVQTRRNPRGSRARTRAASERLKAEFGVENWVAQYDEVYRQAVRVHAGTAGG